MFKKHLAAACSIALVAATTAVVLATGLAHAAPSCQNGGVYLIYARGSGAPIGSNVAILFKQQVQAKLGNFPSAWAELGNLDDSVPSNGTRFPDDPSNEYPAVTGAQLVAFPGYNGSVGIGVAELVNHLNSRATQCVSEHVVLGGYSQGADVMGRAIGDSRLSSAAKARIAYVALYGDPGFFNGGLDHCFGLSPGTGDVRVPWEKGDTDCVAMNIPLEQRIPYVPSDFEHRVGSWCDKGDGFCAHTLSIPGTHTTAYTAKWIPLSASEIAVAAIGKQAYPVGAKVGDGSLIESDEGHLYVYAGGRLFWFDRNNAAQLDAFESQAIRLTGTEVYIPLHHDTVHTIEVNRDNNGNPSAGSHMPADNTWLVEYGNWQQYVVKYGYPFPVGSPEEVVALGGQDKAVIVPTGVNDLRASSPNWVRDDLLRFWNDPTVWHYVDRGFRVPSVQTRDCLQVRHNRSVTLMPASAWNYFPTHATQQAACDFTHGQWLYGVPSNRQVQVLYGVGHYVQYGEVAGLGGTNQARPVSDVTLDWLMGSAFNPPTYHLFKAPNAPTVFMAQGGQFHQVGSPSVRDCLMATYGTVVETVPQSFIDRLPQGAGAQCPYEGRLLMKSGGKVDYVKDGQRHWVQNETVLYCLQGRAGTGNSILVEQWVWDSYPQGADAICPYGRGANFVRENNAPTVWLVDSATGIKRHAGSLCVNDPDTTQLLEFRVWVVPAGETAGYVVGPDWFATGQLCANLPKP